MLSVGLSKLVDNHNLASVGTHALWVPLSTENQQARVGNAQPFGD